MYTQQKAMRSYIKTLLLTQTGKDTSVVFIGTLINIIIGGLFFIFAPRILGPQNYGLFSVVIATGLMAVNLANFGIDTGILRFIPSEKTLAFMLGMRVNPRSEEERTEAERIGESIKKDREYSEKILKLAFKSYVVIGIAVLILGIVISNPLANVLGAPQISNLLKIAFSATVFTLLSNFFVAALQSKKDFLKASLINIASNTSRLAILGIASYFVVVDLYFLTILFFFIAIVSVLLGAFFTPLDFLKTKDEKIHFKTFFGYNFWVAASLAISSIPYDNYILLKFAGPVSTGIFAAPFKILSTTYQFAGSFSRVLAPRFSSFDTNQKAIVFSKKASLFVGVIFLGLFLSSVFAQYFVQIFLGEQYQQSVNVFRILAIGMAFFFAGTIPMALILYYFGKSKIAFYTTIWHYFIYVLLLLSLASTYKEIGASVAFSLSEAINFATLFIYIVYKFNQKSVA